MAVVRALFTGSITPTVTIHEGELWDADDPIVKSRPDFFSADLDSVAHRTVEPSTIEEATAEPGAKRRTSTR